MPLLFLEPVMALIVPDDRQLRRVHHTKIVSHSTLTGSRRERHVDDLGDAEAIAMLRSQTMRRISIETMRRK